MKTGSNRTVTSYLIVLILLPTLSTVTFFYTHRALAKQQERIQLISKAESELQIAPQIVERCLLLDSLPDRAMAMQSIERQLNLLKAAHTEFMPIAQLRMNALYTTWQPFDAAVRLFLKKPNEQRLDLLIQAKNGFVSTMQNALEQYQRDSLDESELLQWITGIIWIGFLCFMLGEFLFVFRPIQREHKAKLQAIEQQNALLKERDAKLTVYEQLSLRMGLGQSAFQLVQGSERPDFILLASNEAAADFTGFNPMDKIGQKVADIFPSFYTVGIDQVFLKVIYNQEIIEFEIEHPGSQEAKAGYYFLRIFPLPNESVGILFENISRRKEMENQLRTYESVVKEMTLGLVVWQLEETNGVLDFILKTSNDEALRQTNNDLKPIGKKMSEIYPDLFVTRLPQFYYKIIRDNSPKRIEEFAFRDRIVSINAFPLPHQSIAIIFENITRKKQMEERLQIYENVVTRMTSGLVVWQLVEDPQGLDFIMVSRNKAAARITGVQIELGTRMSVIYPNFLKTELVQQEYKAIALGEKSNFHDEIYQGDPSMRTTHYSITVFSLPEKRVGVIFDDIADKKKSELTLKRLTSEVLEQKLALENSLERMQMLQESLLESEKLATLGETVAIVAHEINTPIGIAVTAASALQERSTELRDLHDRQMLRRSDLQRYIHYVEEGCQWILSNLQKSAGLIRDFKAVSTRQLSGQEERFNLGELMQQVANTLRPSLRNTHIDLVLDIPKEAIEIDSRPGVFAQIFTNLLTNSLRHGYPHMLPKGKILVRIWRDEQGIHWLHQDDGVGIAPDILPKIFDPFFTTNKEKGGSGLGLSIVENLVKNQLDGTIRCSSQPGQGTQFLIDIPV